MTLQEVTQFADAIAAAAAAGAFGGVLVAEAVAYLPAFIRWMVRKP